MPEVRACEATRSPLKYTSTVRAVIRAHNFCFNKLILNWILSELHSYRDIDLGEQLVCKSTLNFQKLLIACVSLKCLPHKVESRAQFFFHSFIEVRVLRKRSVFSLLNPCRVLGLSKQKVFIFVIHLEQSAKVFIWYCLSLLIN